MGTERKVNIIQSTDWISVIMYLLLVFLGWVNIYAAVYNEDHQSLFDISQKYGKQMLWIGLSVILIIVIYLIDSKFYSTFAYFIFGLMMVTLLAVLIFGKEVNGARSWFEIGPFRIQPAEFAKFATALALSRYLSSPTVHLERVSPWMVLNALILPLGWLIYIRNKGMAILAPVLLLLLLPIGLIFLQNDTGSAIVYATFILVLYREGLPGIYILLVVLLPILFILALIVTPLQLIIGLISISFLLYFIMRRAIKELFSGLLVYGAFVGLLTGINYLAGLNLPIHYALTIGMLFSGVIYFFWAFRFKISQIYMLFIILIVSVVFVFGVDYAFNKVLSAHQQDRIQILLGVKHDIKGAGYNVHQSKIAIGSGGLAGKGFLQGTQTKFDFVPEQSTDFIFCTIGEEWGFAGTTFIMLLFVVFLLRLIFLAERQRSPFSRVYGYCVVAVLFFHIAVNIGMTIGLAPVIGIPLPFFSYGGSSLWSFTILLFIFLRLDASRMQLLY